MCGWNYVRNLCKINHEISLRFHVCSFQQFDSNITHYMTYWDSVFNKVELCFSCSGPCESVASSQTASHPCLVPGPACREASGRYTGPQSSPLHTSPGSSSCSSFPPWSVPLWWGMGSSGIAREWVCRWTKNIWPSYLTTVRSSMYCQISLSPSEIGQFCQKHD